MSRRFRRFAVFALVALPLVGTGFVLGQRYPQNGYRLYQAVLQMVGQEAVDSLDADSLYTMSARGLIAVLDDPYAELFSRRDFESFSRNQLGNRYGGIGLRIVRVRDTIQVWRVIPGGPAAAAGIQRGDRIVRVGDSTAVGWTTERTANNLTGTPGTDVAVGLVRRAGQPYDVTLTRAVISVSVVPFTSVLDGSIGYIPVQRFSDNAAHDVAQAIRRLQDQGATSFLLDLRNNPGGSLDQAVAVANLFLDAGRPIVTVKARHTEDTLRGRMAPQLSARTPVVVLIDSTSASASEIVAGALQDYDRALIVGTNSFGKGVVQGAYPLPDGWVLKLTTARWFTPIGRPLQRTRADSAMAVRPTYRTVGGRMILGGGGVVPDITVYADTFTSTAVSLNRLLNTRLGVVTEVLDRYAGELEATASPDFTVTREWRTELLRRLRAAGLLLPDTLGADAGTYLDRVLETSVSTLMLSDSAAFHRRAVRDAQLNRATGLLRGLRTQAELLSAAVRRPQG